MYHNTGEPRIQDVEGAETSILDSVKMQGVSNAENIPINYEMMDRENDRSYSGNATRQVFTWL